MTKEDQKKKSKKPRKSRPETRLIRYTVRFNDEEMRQVLLLAARAGMANNIACYLRLSALGAPKPKQIPPTWDQRVFGSLGDINNNLGQIADRAKEAGRDDLAAAANAVLNQVITFSKLAMDGKIPPPADLGMDMRDRFLTVGESLNRVAKEMNATGKMDREDQAFALFAVIADIINEVLDVR